MLCGNVSYNSTTLGRSKIFSGDESDASMRGRLSKDYLSASFVVPLGNNSIKIYENMVPQEQDILYPAGWVPARTRTLETNSIGSTLLKSHKPCNLETFFLVLCPGTMVIKHDCTLKLPTELLKNTSAWVPTPQGSLFNWAGGSLAVSLERPQGNSDVQKRLKSTAVETFPPGAIKALDIIVCGSIVCRSQRSKVT